MGPRGRTELGTALMMCRFLCLSCFFFQIFYEPHYKCVPLTIKNMSSASPFLCFQLAEELIYQGWREEVKELVGLFSSPHFKVNTIVLPLRWCTELCLKKVYTVQHHFSRRNRFNMLGNAKGSFLAKFTEKTRSNASVTNIKLHRVWLRLEIKGRNKHVLKLQVNSFTLWNFEWMRGNLRLLPPVSKLALNPIVLYVIASYCSLYCVKNCGLIQHKDSEQLALLYKKVKTKGKKNTRCCFHTLDLVWIQQTKFDMLN